MLSNATYWCFEHHKQCAIYLHCFCDRAKNWAIGIKSVLMPPFVFSFLSGTLCVTKLDWTVLVHPSICLACWWGLWYLDPWLTGRFCCSLLAWISVTFGCTHIWPDPQQQSLASGADTLSSHMQVNSWHIVQDELKLWPRIWLILFLFSISWCLCLRHLGVAAIGP